MDVTLKKNNLKISEFLAKNNLSHITDKEELHDKIEDIVYMLSEESFCHSLTPSGEIGQNPLTKNLIQDLPFATLIDEFLIDGTEKEKKQLERELIRSVNTLTNIFMRIKISKKLLKKHAKKDYFKKSDSRKVTRDNMEEVEVSRYFNLMVSSILFGRIDKIFRQDVGSYEGLLEQGIARVKLSKMKLASNKTRKAFIKLFFEMEVEE